MAKATASKSVIVGKETLLNALEGVRDDQKYAEFGRRLLEAVIVTAATGKSFKGNVSIMANLRECEPLERSPLERVANEVCITYRYQPMFSSHPACLEFCFAVHHTE